MSNQDLFLEYEYYNMGALFYFNVSKYKVKIYNDYSCILKVNFDNFFHISKDKIKNIIGSNTLNFEISKLDFENLRKTII